MKTFLKLKENGQLRLLLNLSIVSLFISSSIYAQIDTTRVAIVGNSITEGWSLSSPTLDSYPAQLGLLLGDSYNVFNFGVSARTMLKKGDYPIWNESLFEAALESEPDIVIILLGSNDSKPHNWQYKDEFVPDYIAMIDTFRQLESNPKIYACYPPPSFGDPFGIRDSIFTNDIIPMIDQIVDSLNVSLVDFHTPLLDDAPLFPDGVHPNVGGAWQMAQMLADTLAGVKVESENEVNLAKHKPVIASGSNDFFPPEELNDGDRLTKWRADGFDNWAIINIGEVEEIDMFQVDFGDEFNKGFQYTIDVSSDSVDWTTVVDQSACNDTVTKITVDKIDPITAQYIKITVTGASNSEQEITSISEFKILKSAFVHSPVLNWRLRVAREDRLSYYLDIIPTSCDEEMIKYYKKVDDGIFSGTIGFRPAEVQERTEIMRAGEVHHIYTETYKNEKILISDTIAINFDYFTSINPKINHEHPVSYNLSQNYPNPFNPSTTIHYSIPIHSHVKIDVYDINGHQLTTLVDAKKQAGTHKILFNGGNNFSSGIYFYRLKTDQYEATKKMLFIK